MTKNKLIIIGASGHGRVVADIARLNGYNDVVFLDNDKSLTSCAGYPVLGPDTMARELEGNIFVAVGNPEARKRLMDRYADRTFPILIHPSAVVAENVQIGSGSVIMAGAVVNPGAKIGRGVIINTSSSIDHDCIIGDFVHVAVGSHLSGTVEVGDLTWIGTGATVLNNLNICGGCTIGAGAVVIREITDAGVYIGIPAMKYTKETNNMNQATYSKGIVPPPPRAKLVFIRFLLRQQFRLFQTSGTVNKETHNVEEITAGWQHRSVA